MNLVHLRLRRGEAIAEERIVDSKPLYFCAKHNCPHYRGQLGLLAGAETMQCALVGYAPQHICQAFYIETAEDLDRLRRQTWDQRLAEAEAFESAVATAAAQPGSAGIPAGLPAPPLPEEGRAMGEGVGG